MHSIDCWYFQRPWRFSRSRHFWSQLYQNLGTKFL